MSAKGKLTMNLEPHCSWVLQDEKVVEGLCSSASACSRYRCHSFKNDLPPAKVNLGSYNSSLSFIDSSSTSGDKNNYHRPSNNIRQWIVERACQWILCRSGRTCLFQCQPFFSVFANPETSLVKYFLLDTCGRNAPNLQSLSHATIAKLGWSIRKLEIIWLCWKHGEWVLSWSQMLYRPLKLYVEGQFHSDERVSNRGVETKAVSQTEYYYTSKTIQQVLEYICCPLTMSCR
jgi:hypothetical protein